MSFSAVLPTTLTVAIAISLVRVVQPKLMGYLALGARAVAPATLAVRLPGPLHRHAFQDPLHVKEKLCRRPKAINIARP